MPKEKFKELYTSESHITDRLLPSSGDPVPWLPKPTLTLSFTSGRNPSRYHRPVALRVPELPLFLSWVLHSQLLNRGLAVKFVKPMSFVVTIYKLSPTPPHGSLRVIWGPSVAKPGCQGCELPGTYRFLTAPRLQTNGRLDFETV